MSESEIKHSYNIKYSSDKMKLFIEVAEGNGGLYETEAAFRDGLREAGVDVPVNDELLRKIFSEPEYYRREEIGVGVEAKHGKDAYVKYEITFADKPVFIPDDSEEPVDYREAIQFVLVKSGDKIAELIPPTLGEPGKNVLGKPVAALAGKGMSVKEGNGVERKGNVFYAKRSGLPKEKSGLFLVEDFLEIKGSVCMKTGNIKYPGAVIIHGDLEDSFEIQSDDDVKIMGIMGDAKIKAKGNVTIAGGILGREKAEVRCEGRLEAKFAQNATLEVSGDILITKDIRHCTVNTLGSVHVSKGGIIGGVCTAFQRVEVAELGSESSTKTKIRLGFNYEIDKLETVFKSFIDIGAKLELKHKAALENNEIPAKELPHFAQTLKAVSQLVERAETVKKQIRLRQSQSEKHLEGAKISLKVAKKIWSEVMLYAPNCFEEFSETLTGERFLVPNVETGNFSKG